MSNDPFERNAIIFYARNQGQLEKAMWGGELTNSARESMRESGLKQIERHRDMRTVEDMAYKSTAEIQVGVLEMGLGYSWPKPCYKVLDGLRTAMYGDEYTILNGVMMAGCVLAYWTNKAAADSRSHCRLTLSLPWGQLNVRQASTSGSLQYALFVPYSWLSIYDLLWDSGSNGAMRVGVSRRSDEFESASEAAKAIDRFSRNSLTVYDWMMGQIHLID